MINIISDIIIPLLSLSGVLAGILLSYLASAEIASGKKYFVLSYRILFVMLSAMLCYAAPLYLALLFFAIALVLLLLDLKKYSPYFFAFHYLFFLLGYFVAEKNILIAALLFVYGLPVGTLLRTKSIK